MQKVWAAEDIARSFGRVLRSVRTAKQMSQQQLAFEADVDRTYVSLLERGLRQPTITTLFQLGAALGVKPEALVQDSRALLENSAG